MSLRFSNLTQAKDFPVTTNALDYFFKSIDSLIDLVRRNDYVLGADRFPAKAMMRQISLCAQRTMDNPETFELHNADNSKILRNAFYRVETNALGSLFAILTMVETKADATSELIGFMEGNINTIYAEREMAFSLLAQESGAHIEKYNPENLRNGLKAA